MDQYDDIRQGVSGVCAGFPGEYWRAHDRNRTYAKEFVEALSICSASRGFCAAPASAAAPSSQQ